MTAKLHLGSDSFDLPDDPTIDQLAETLLTAFQQSKAVQVQVLVDGHTLLLIVNPQQVPFAALDIDGTWMGFHSG